FWLAIGDEYVAEHKVRLDALGLTMRNWVIWHYTFGVHCEKKFTRSHAHLLYYVADAKRFTFNADAVRVPSARQMVYADRRANPKGRVPDDTWVLRPQEDARFFRPDGDTWYVPRVCGTFKERTGHPCQMPEAVLDRIIRVTTNPGDVVLDPFAGSGTTLVVAKRLGRRFLGIELSENYAEEVRQRLELVGAGVGAAGATEGAEAEADIEPAAASNAMAEADTEPAAARTTRSRRGSRVAETE
ncbi:MAG: site-specific DNA-methyltransferase, partial [Gemmataceae bacterium]|nr:site-specific DNA-methyltransferase [Gemmataceae bacterium]